MRLIYDTEGFVEGYTAPEDDWMRELPDHYFEPDTPHYDEDDPFDIESIFGGES
jgi:hypothetical protein